MTTLFLPLLALFGCPHPDLLEDVMDERPPLELPSDDPLADFTVPDLPLWTNKYADTREDYGRFFNMSTLMDEYGFSRLQAVELQNQFRDARRADPMGFEVQQFSTALRAVQAGEFESAVDPKRMADAPFIVVFDLDETLYAQYYDAELGKTCKTVSFEQGDKTKNIQMTPGWESAFTAIRELGGEVVLFSANLDDRTLENLEHIEFNGKPLRGHPEIGGIMTNSFLVMQQKSAGPPVIEPSKDLRFFDESLEKVIIVDDNPKRLFQFANARVFRKFHADEWCRPDLDAAQKAAFDRSMAQVEAEIRDSVKAMNADKISFATAYLPYTSLGIVAVDALQDGNGWDEAKAVAHLRDHPELADRKY